MSKLLRLEGKVVDQDQRPVSSVDVRLEPGDQVVKTTIEGTFAFEGLPARRYWVSARRDELYAGPSLVRLDEQDQQVSLELRRGGSLIVHAFANRAPVVGAKLVVADEMLEASTDENGVAVVRGLAPHSHDAWLITKEGAVESVHILSHTDPADVFETFRRVRGGALVEGVVLRPGLIPVSGATIRFCSFSGHGWIAGPTTTSDGRWSLSLPEGMFLIAASSPTYGPTNEVRVHSDGQTPQRGLRVRVDGRRNVSGIVVDKHGKPVAHAWVGGVGVGGSGYHGCSDSEGMFTFSGLSLGAHQFYASTWSQASANVSVDRERSGAFWALMRRIRRAPQLRLVVEDARIAGRVIREDGEAYAEARVELVSSGRSRFPMAVETDTSGRFDLGAFATGDYTIRAMSKDSPSEANHSELQPVRTGDAEVELSLGVDAVIRGRVLLGSQPLPFFGVSFSTFKNRKGAVRGGSTVVRDADGRFAVRVRHAGTYSVYIVGPGARRKVVEDVEIGPRQELDLGDIVVERAEHITGYVRDAAGAPVASARVIAGHAPYDFPFRSALERLFQCAYETTTNEAGRYELDGVDVRSEGKPRRIWATHPKYGASVIRELLTEDSTVDFELLGSGRIEGKVKGLGGGHPSVFARRDDEPEGARPQMIRQNGEFAFDDLPAGSYTVSLRVPGTVETSPANVTVVDGQTVSVVLAMSNQGVRLIVKVPEGCGLDLVLASADKNTPEPDQAKPRIVMGEGTMTVNGKLTKPRTGKERVSFDHMVPGNYRASIDGLSWTPIIVTSSPSEQTVEITRPQS